MSDATKQPRYLTRAEVIKRLRRHLKAAGYFGAQIELARAAGVSHCAVSHALNDERAFLGDRLLDALGLRKVVLFEVVGDPVPIPKRARSRKAQSLLTVLVPPPVQGSRMTVHRME